MTDSRPLCSNHVAVNLAHWAQVEGPAARIADGRH